jgi:ABC-2 type transport system ATP-binding protein
MNPLSMNDVTQSFRRRVVLDRVSLEVPVASVSVLLGPNGAGKSTLMRLALGLLRPDAGTISICGRDPVRQARSVRGLVGYVPDRPDVHDWMTPRELCGFLRPQYPVWNDELVERLSDRFGLPRDTRFRSLSRGEGAKAMLIAALAPEPRLLLLDEPFSGLDPVVRNELLSCLLEELATGERAALVATHDLDVAARIADRVIVLADGRVSTDGNVAEVLGTAGEPGRLPHRLYDLLENAA